MTTFADILQTISTSGTAAALAAACGLVIKLVAWRMQVRDVERYNDRVATVNADVRAQLKTPPAIPDVLSKIIIAVLLMGLTAWAAFPLYRLGLGVAQAKVRSADPASERNCPEDCNGAGCGCVGGQCRCTAAPKPAAVQNSSPAQKPLSDSVPPRYMDTRPGGFPDRPPGTYSAAGGVYRY